MPSSEDSNKPSSEDSNMPSSEDDKSLLSTEDSRLLKITIPSDGLNYDMVKFHQAFCYNTTVSKCKSLTINKNVHPLQ